LETLFYKKFSAVRPVLILKKTRRPVKSYLRMTICKRQKRTARVPANAKIIKKLFPKELKKAKKVFCKIVASVIKF